MNQLSKLGRTVSLVFLSFLTTTIAFAQDEATDLEMNITIDDGGAFYTQVWFWIIVGLVFILLLIVLLRGGGQKKEPDLKDKSNGSV